MPYNIPMEVAKICKLEGISYRGLDASSCPNSTFAALAMLANFVAFDPQVTGIVMALE